MNTSFVPAHASGDITNQDEFVIVGSQSMLGPVPRSEDVFNVSMEVDIYPLQAPELADRIDGAIGEGSQFHQTCGPSSSPAISFGQRGYIPRSTLRPPARLLKSLVSMTRAMKDTCHLYTDLAWLWPMWGDSATEYAHYCQHVSGLIRKHAQRPVV